MDKLLHSRLFRCLVCLVLVCCILVNTSPIKSKATAIVAGLTVAEVLGYLTLIVGTTAGAVYMVNSREEVAAIGQSISIGDEPGDEDALDHVVKLTENINGMWDAGGDGSGFDPRLGTKIAQGLLALIGGTLVTGIVSGSLEGKAEEEVTADVGYVYCNGIQMPEFSDVIKGHIADGYSYVVMYYGGLKKPNFRVALTYGTFSVGGYNNWDYENYLCITNRNVYSDYYYIYGTNSAGVWSLLTKGYDKGAPVQDVCSEGCGILFSSGSITNFADDSVYSDAFGSISDTSTTTVPVLPEIYVGDLPSQIENGDLDEDESKKRILAPLPDYIDITKIIKSPETAVEDLTQWQQQVVDNQKTLEQTIDDITADSGGSGGSGGSDSGDDSGDDSEDQERPPITDILPYGLDLTDYFPFCIPFDLYDFFTCLDAAPRAPKFHWEIQDLSGGAYAIDIDLSPWDEVAALFRHLQLLLFVVGLAAATRKYIKW